MKKEIFKVLHYFQLFDYAPTFEEIYTFLPKKTTKKELKKELERLVNKKIIGNWKLEIGNCFRYTVGEYGIEKSKIKNQKSKIIKSKLYFNDFKKRYSESEKKLKNWWFRLYIKLISLFPQIKLVGLSGSLAMMNAKKDDDIDLFIITAKNRLFTGRFISIVLAWILGIRRKRIKENARRRVFSSASPPTFVGGSPKRLTQKQASSLFKNKVCLNLFFDESSLEVPDFKKTEYVAHEVLQMKPLIIKDNIYHRFLTANKWTFKVLPNAIKVARSKKQESRKKILNTFANKIESLLKKLQLYVITRHRTTEIITEFQLWFHPEDFEKKIKKNKLLYKL